MVITTRLPPWGATKQAADAFAKIRELKNRVAELEDELTAAGAMNTEWHPTGNEIYDLECVTKMPVAIAEQWGMTRHVANLTHLHQRLVDWNTIRQRVAMKKSKERDACEG